MSSLSGLTSTSSQPAISFNGLISGLDTTSVINGLLALDQAQINSVTQKQTVIQNKQTIYKQVEAHLLTLQGDLQQLNSLTNSAFDAKTATSSNPDVISAAASSSAAPGIYSLRVNNLAQAQQVTSQGFDSPTSAITQGTLQFQIGNGAVTTVTVDSSNNTLQGLAGAINSANTGLTASVINDGTASQPYHLLLTARNTGTANAVTITNNLAASGSGATQPVFDTIVQAAQDASVTLGSGAGALTVTNATNQINNLIAGVTLQLQSTSPTNPITVTVAADTTGAQKAIQSFITDYNGLTAFIKQQNSYDPASNTAGPLFGDGSINGIVSQLERSVQGVVQGANPSMNRLGALGISFDSTGQLQVNSTTLNNALNGNIAGVSLGDIKKLFGMFGTANNPGVTFIAGSDQTQASQTPYVVNITQAAAQASITATSALATSVHIDGTNDQFSFSLDGKSTTLTLAGGDYTQGGLAQMLQSAINSDHDLAGRQISVGLQGGMLTFTSGSFGSSSQVAIGSGSANSALGLAGTENSAGQDVAGNFVVNGVTEPAQGVGQFLTGNRTNANTAALEVRVTLNSTQVGGGVQANVSVSRGIASQLDQLMNQLTDPLTGRLKAIDDSFNSQITALKNQQVQLTNALNVKQQSLQKQFADMETTLAQLQTASSAINSLASSLAALTTSPQTRSSFSSSSQSSGS
jgi:flagellar hook-associated protein 2